VYSTEKEDVKEYLGIYQGQMKDGMRHGRGTFIGKDHRGKTWTYRPLDGKSAHNWSRDKMHGISVVEDEKHIHENVIFTENLSQMPWAEGLLTNGKLQQLIDETYSSIKSVLEKQEENFPRPRLRRRAQEVRNPDLIMAESGEAAATLLRQPTDLNMPHEDVLISGADSIENQDMNGLYVRMSEAFGLAIYRNTKIVREVPNMQPNSSVSIASLGKCARRSLAGTAVEKAVTRYLYQDPKRECWIISESPSYDTPERVLNLHRSAAMVESSDPHPGLAAKPWYVWHEDTQSMRLWLPRNQFLAEELETVTCGMKQEKKLRPVDRLTIQCVMGLIVDGHNGLIHGLMLRHPSMFFGRPVYEAENGGQYLYWFQQGKMVEDGWVIASMVSPTKALDEVDPDDEAKINEGWWIIARQVGCFQIEDPKFGGRPANGIPDHSDVLAYVPSKCHAPHQIVTDDPEACWKVKDGETFTDAKDIKIRLDHFKNTNNALDLLDDIRR
jgi:hypothetical protein